MSYIGTRKGGIMSNEEMIGVLRKAAESQTGNIPLKMLLLYAAERIEKLGVVPPVKEVVTAQLHRHDRNCQCVICKPLERPCNCEECKAVVVRPDPAWKITRGCRDCKKLKDDHLTALAEKDREIHALKEAFALSLSYQGGSDCFCADKDEIAMAVLGVKHGQ
jgi:hypothetical protein